ncbi:MAG: PAS domain-containing protein [Candidatus Scalindua sp.]|nr:PAS domain-containing protein [Candidatus Scalindua sp.]MDV5165225.1 PAS domain-containing protein [Candidatus Scalindua sp.]
MQYILDNTTSVIYLKDTQGKYIFANRQYLNLFHITKEEIIGMTDYDIFPKEMADAFQANDRKVIRTQAPLEIEEVALQDDEPHTYISIKFPLFDSNGIAYGICGISTDITERKKAEKILQEQKEALEQKNIALNEILGQIEIEKKQIKDNVISNVENLLLPIIQKLRLTGESRMYVRLLQENIQELTSSFGTKLTEKGARLTSREVEVCDMIKNGLTSKEIAGLLNISLRTVETHRIKIRKKLGIVKKDLNLSSFLKTL